MTEIKPGTVHEKQKIFPCTAPGFLYKNTMIPGSKGRKFDLGLLAREFLTLGSAKNMEEVTTFLCRRIIENHGDPDRETLNLVLTYNGKDYYKDDEGNGKNWYKL